jgi:hypothetical protein
MDNSRASRPGLLRRAAKEAESDGKPLYLFLRDVTASDDGGRSLLRHLARNSVRVSGGGVYTSYVVEELTTADSRQISPLDADDGVNQLSGKKP